MKLQRESHLDINNITRYDASSVTVNGERYAEGVIVMPADMARGWGSGEALQTSDIERIVAMRPALAIIGTGERLVFPAPEVLRPLIEAGIGFEVMDTGSACRTYNLLAGEGRLVAAALMVSHGE